MTQEDKKLLLKDLCARLPYGVKVHIEEKHIDESPYTSSCTSDCINLVICGFSTNLLVNIDKYRIKPYLRPMSSMTEEEENDLEYKTDDNYVDYCNEHHIDYRGLIEKGLALKAPEGMYKTE